MENDVYKNWISIQSPRLTNIVTLKHELKDSKEIVIQLKPACYTTEKLIVCIRKQTLALLLWLIRFSDLKNN